MARNLLEIATQSEESFTISVDGKQYPLTDQDSMSLLTRKRLVGGFIGAQKKLQGVQDKALNGDFEEIDDSLIESVSTLIDKTLAEACPALPREVSQKLSDAKKMQILTAFFSLGASKPETLPATGLAGTEK